MHYYKRNIGDYHKKAGRLNLLQHGVYTILMDAIYDREKFPTREEAIDWCWASTPEEITAVEFVLAKFFVNGDGTYRQSRMQQEIEDYTEFCILQTEKGKKGGRPKGINKPAGLITEPNGLINKPNDNPTEPETTLTTNHKPERVKKLTLPAEINPAAWGEFEQHRKEIRKPLSDLARSKAINAIVNLPKDEQAKVINKTIQNRWTGLFPDKNTQPKNAFWELGE